MDNTNMNYDAIRKVLKTVPISYKGVKVVFSHISTDTYEGKSEAPYGRVYRRKEEKPSKMKFIDCHYIVNIEETSKPFVTIELLDGISDKLLKWGKMIFGSNKVKLNPKLTLKRKGYEDIQVPPPNRPQHEETIFDIMIGTENEKILDTFSGQGMMESPDGRIEYFIDKYGKSTKNLDTWTYVEDSKLCFAIDVYMSDFDFISYTQGMEFDNNNELMVQYVKEIKKITDVSESYTQMEELIQSVKNLGDLVPSNTPLKIKNLSPLSQQLFEIAIYFYGDESYSLDSVLPGLSIVCEKMSQEIEFPDSYVRVQPNLMYKGNRIKNTLDYYPDSTAEAEDSLLLSLLVDWIDENH